MKDIKPGEDCTEYLRANSPMIYHYCGGNAFLNIIQTKTIWLSHSDYMNDYQECRLLDRIFFDAKDKCDRYFSSKITQVNEIYTRYFSNSINRYISSFSLTGDLLSQWRGYADNGTGFVFGFNSYDLTRHLKSVLSGVDEDSYKYQFLFTPKVNYDLDLWMKDNGLQRIVIDCISRHIDDPISAAFNIKILSTQYKHPSFSEEQEYRIVYVIDQCSETDSFSKLQFRCSMNNSIVPYYPLSIPNPSVVVIGPRNEMHEEQVKFFLARAGCATAQVLRSDASYC